MKPCSDCGKENEPQLKTCDVCGIEKLCKFCNDCNAWICTEDETNWIERGKAAFRRLMHLPPRK